MSESISIPWYLARNIVDHVGAERVTEVHITSNKIIITSFRVGEDSEFLVARDEMNLTMDLLTQTVEYAIDYTKLDPPKQGWYSAHDAENGFYMEWQPTLQTDGQILEVEIYFATKEECDQFIKDRIIGRGWYHGEEPV